MVYVILSDWTVARICVYNLITGSPCFGCFTECHSDVTIVIIVTNINYL